MIQMFDRLCRMVEAAGAAGIPHADRMRRMASQSRLFDFSEPVLSTDTERLSAEDREHLCSLIHMPFPVIAMTDGDGAVILAQEEDAVGLFNLKLRFMELLHRDDETCFQWGQFRVVRPLGGNFQYKLNVHGMAVARGDTPREVRWIPPLEAHQVQALCRAQGEPGVNLGVFVEQLRLINLPSHMIVEERPARLRPPQSKLIPRAHERPRYTLLTPGLIRRRYPGFGGGTHGSPRTHERRRHLRLLSSERFVNKRGQRIVVAACWVGPTEYAAGRRTYRVLLDH